LGKELTLNNDDSLLTKHHPPTSRNSLPISPGSHRSKAGTLASLSRVFRLVDTKTWLRLRVLKSACAHYRSLRRRRAIGRGLVELSGLACAIEEDFGREGDNGTYMSCQERGTRKRRHRSSRRPICVSASCTTQKDINVSGGCTTYCNQAMILQNRSLAIAQTLSDLPALLAIQHDSAKVRVHRMAFIEAQAILCHHVELAAEDGEGFAVGAVAWVRYLQR
jgi:hypothetical protein